MYLVMAVIAILVVCVFSTGGGTALAAQPPELQTAHWRLTTADDWHAGTLDGLMAVADEGGDGALTLGLIYCTGICIVRARAGSAS